MLQMENLIMRWLIGSVLLLVALLAMAPVRAQDDDDDGGAVLNPALQWSVLERMWANRLYDDFLPTAVNFAEKNNTDNNALECWWRCYLVTRDYRRNDAKRKVMFDYLQAATVDWEKRYAATDKERAARALWYRGYSYGYENQKAIAISTFQTAVKKYGGTTHDHNLLWHCAEWLREANRHAESIPYFEADRQIYKGQEHEVVCMNRMADAYTALGDQASAIAIYQDLLNGNYQWGWGQVHWGAWTAANRLREWKEDQLARALCMKIIDKCPADWDVAKNARAFLGEATGVTKYIHFYSYLNETFVTDRVNLDARNKITVSRDESLLLRLERVSKDDPFKGTLAITPKREQEKKADNMKASEDGKTLQADIDAPNAQGQVPGDIWYRFYEENRPADVPDGLVVTRTWEKKGDGWGECTIRIQSPARWHLWVTLPNNRTNVNNLSLQPNEVNDNGRTFRWYDWYDLRQGWTIKFPVEVGGNVNEYYPQIRFERGYWGHHQNASGNSKEAKYSTFFYDIKMTSENPFAFGFEFPGNRVVLMKEVSK